MNLRHYRLAILAAVNAFFDVAETSDDASDIVPSRGTVRPTIRRTGVRPPVTPAETPTEVDRAAARQELRRMGVKVPR
jgi:hypothetical protein